MPAYLVYSLEFIVGRKNNKKSTNYQLKTNNSSGFTLVEILVVISIIAIITVLAAVNFKGNREEQILQREVYKLQSALRQAQTNASSSAVCQALGGGAFWKVQINPGSKQVSIICKKGTSDELEESRFILEEEVNIELFCPQALTTPIDAPVSITYSPFSGIPKFSGTPNTCQGLIVKLTHAIKTEAGSKQFSISSGGAVNAK